MLNRKILGIKYGAAIISEGVFHFMHDAEILSSNIHFTFDEHGHPELGNVSKAYIFNILLQERLKALNLKIKSRPVELGYEMRACAPIAFDLMYCSLLGFGVKRLFDQGYTGCMVMSETQGDVKPLFLKDVEDGTGKIKPRMVNIETQRTRIMFEDSLHYLSKGDYEAAKQFVPNPELYDFFKILEWDN
jgi:6-phosphofructokinase 1